MAAETINTLFYVASHYPGNEVLGDGVTTLNTMLENQYIPMASEMYEAITDEGLALTGTSDAQTFGSTYELENQVVAYISSYLAEVDLHPKEFQGNDSPVWASRFMQMALQVLQIKYPNKIEARTLGGGGLVWILKPDIQHNVSVKFGIMRNKYGLFNSDEGSTAPASTDDAYGR